MFRTKSLRSGRSASGGYDQYHRSLQLLGQLGMLCDLISRWCPFQNVPYGESPTNQRVECRSYSAMVLDHTLRKPVRRAWTLDGIAVDGPRLATFLVDRSTRVGRSHVDRMFNRKNEMRVWY